MSIPGLINILEDSDQTLDRPNLVFCMGILPPCVMCSTTPAKVKYITAKDSTVEKEITIPLVGTSVDLSVAVLRATIDRLLEVYWEMKDSEI